MCRLTGQEQACFRFSWLIFCLFVCHYEKMARYICKKVTVDCALVIQIKSQNFFDWVSESVQWVTRLCNDRTLIQQKLIHPSLRTELFHLESKSGQWKKGEKRIMWDEKRLQFNILLSMSGGLTWFFFTSSSHQSIFKSSQQLKTLVTATIYNSLLFTRLSFSNKSRLIYL